MKIHLQNKHLKEYLSGLFISNNPMPTVFTNRERPPWLVMFVLKTSSYFESVSENITVRG